MQRLLDGRPGGDALHEGLQVRPGREVDAGEIGPVGHDEGVGVGNGEAIADEELAAVG